MWNGACRVGGRNHDFELCLGGIEGNNHGSNRGPVAGRGLVKPQRTRSRKRPSETIWHFIPEKTHVHGYLEIANGGAHIWHIILISWRSSDLFAKICSMEAVNLRDKFCIWVITTAYWSAEDEVDPEANGTWGWTGGTGAWTRAPVRILFKSVLFMFTEGAMALARKIKFYML